MIDLTREVRVIALTKALTDWIEARGYGAFLCEPEAAGARAALYDAARLRFSTWEDREAANRVRIWIWRVRAQEVA